MKTNDIFVKIYRTIRCKYRHGELKFASWMGGTFYDRILFRQTLGYRLNYKNPVTMHEKMMWLNRYWQPQLKVDCADKLRVREYVKSCGWESLLIPLLGVWKTVDEVDFASLPNQFVLKTNHGCGMNIICTDKTLLGQNEVKLKLSKWLATDYGRLYNERHYSRIRPCIIAEKYLPSLGQSIVDYKFHCFAGDIFCILLCANRDSTGHVDLYSYTTKWERVPLLVNEEETLSLEFKKPQNINEMIQAARILSKPFPYVRVDFYEVEGKVYLGELTFTPRANLMIYYKEDTLQKMADKLVLPDKSPRKCSYKYIFDKSTNE